MEERVLGKRPSRAEIAVEQPQEQPKKCKEDDEGTALVEEDDTAVARRAILDVMHSGRIRIPEEGFPLLMIVELLGEEFEARDIREALDELVNRGEVHTTVDDNTFAGGMAPVTTPTAYYDCAWDELTKSIYTLYDNFRPGINGLSLEEMHTHLNARYPTHEIRRRCEALADDGYVYSTVDDFHYARI